MSGRASPARCCSWPRCATSRAQALVALQRFITERLPLFGRYQDAIWPGEPWLYHAHLSAALNLKLLNPREVVDAAVAAYRAGAAPLAGVCRWLRKPADSWRIARAVANEGGEDRSGRWGT